MSLTVSPVFPAVECARCCNQRQDAGSIHLHTRAVLIAWLAVLTAVGTAPASARGTNTVQLRSADGTVLTAYLVRSRTSETTAPTVIALHGCGGPLNRRGTRLNDRHRSWGSILSQAGYNVLFPDSFGSRGHKSLCRVRPRPVRQRDRLQDVLGALEWSAKQPFVRAGAISLLGWSNGATTALHAARARPAALTGAIIAFYPGCRSLLERARSDRMEKLTLLMGAADDWTAPSHCIRLARTWQFRIVLYEGAYHGFDAPRSRFRQRNGLAFTPDGTGRAHVGTHPQARREAIGEVLSILSRVAAKH